MSNLNLLSRFARYGVLHREAVKNDLRSLQRLMRQGMVQKVFRQGRVFYELTSQAVVLVEQLRKIMLEEVKLYALLNSPAQEKFRALVDDLRFFDEQSPVAEKFLFLGDWQLTRPVVSGQLELSKLRFYREHVPTRQRRKYT